MKFPIVRTEGLTLPERM